MNKKAALSDNLMHNVIMLVFLAIVIGGIYLGIRSQMSGAGIWENYYSKEISRLINLAEPGDSMTLDIQKATEIARRNQVRSFSESFLFDNVNNDVCVKLSLGKKTCYSYFNEVDVFYEIELGVPGNILKLEVKEKQGEGR